MPRATKASSLLVEAEPTVDRGFIINALNDAIASGDLKVVNHGLFGASRVATADGSTEIEHVSQTPRGMAGAIHYLADFWELRVAGRPVARFNNSTSNLSLKEPYERATRWLYLKLQKTRHSGIPGRSEPAS